ncbi:hypothetical protein [Vibrio sinaloensis]|uniref:hypothetical protein n=1 Tax=Photobacterium sp. (strain ATCC 43367) TaxID=379097 RepID=UPI0006934602|nr:hypothetical protein [Vibrio sinaloensis]
MKKQLLVTMFISSSVFTASSLADSGYLGVDSFLDGSQGSIQYGFDFTAEKTLRFGYELAYTQHTEDVRSFGLNMKPTFPIGTIYLTPILGYHKFNDGLGAHLVYGFEIGQSLGLFDVRAGYKQANTEFDGNGNVYLGAALRF